MGVMAEAAFGFKEFFTFFPEIIIIRFIQQILSYPERMSTSSMVMDFYYIRMVTQFFIGKPESEDNQASGFTTYY